tara:strand:+ start:13948 stop:14859 length:912 start_codon:yes stop_codon:yes gene_type:complete
MRHLNYNHLLYFWTVAKEGSVVRAAEKLNLTPQTISGQLKMLEDTIGEALFERAGRGLAITDTGRIVEQYANEIFSLGAELTQRIKSKTPGSPSAFNIGIVNSIPKLISYKILQPGLSMEDPIKLVCFEGDLENLLADLAVHKLDMVLADRPIPTGLNVKAFSHSLGCSNLAFFGHPALISKTLKEADKKTFPDMLDGAPLIMPLHTNALRRSLEDWFEQTQITPQVIAEFDDSALLKVFGQAGTGFFAAPSVIADQVQEMYGVQKIGDINNVQENYFVISPERHLKHPAVVEITDAAKLNLA